MLRTITNTRGDAHEYMRFLEEQFAVTMFCCLYDWNESGTKTNMLVFFLEVKVIASSYQDFDF